MLHAWSACIPFLLNASHARSVDHLFSLVLSKLAPLDEGADLNNFVSNSSNLSNIAQRCQATADDILKEKLIENTPILGVMEAADLDVYEAAKHTNLNIGAYGEMALAAGKRLSKNDDHGLTSDECGAFNLYTQDSPFFREMNKYCRDQDRRNLKPFYPVMKHMLKGRQKLPAFSGVGWRGIRDLDMTQQYKKDEIIWWWSWSSISKDMQQLQKNNFLGTEGVRTQFMVETTTGMDITRYSAYPDEAEILLCPGTRFRVIATADLGSGLFQVHLKEEPPREIVFG